MSQPVRLRWLTQMPQLVDLNCLSRMRQTASPLLASDSGAPACACLLLDALAEERQPQACPLACFLRIGGQLAVQIKLPACISLAVAGRDVSWYALRVQLQAAATAVGASDQLHQLQADVAIVTQSWPAIRR